MWRITLVGLAALCGCVPPAVLKDPVTGQVAQCAPSSPPALFPIIAHHEVSACASTYERLGWQRQ